MKKRYAQVGTGGRARFFYLAVASTYKETSEIVAFCDVNQTRMDYAKVTARLSYFAESLSKVFSKPEQPQLPEAKSEEDSAH